MSDQIPFANLAIGDFYIVRIPLSDVAEQDLQAVALRLSDLAGFEIRQDSGEWSITISALSESSVRAVDTAKHFSNGLIDQKLRASIAKQTEAERNLILSYAFSNTQLISNSDN